MKKFTLKDMENLAKSKRGECLSKRYVNFLTELEWKCAKGHIFMAIPHNIKNGSWCPECLGLKKLTLPEMKEIARSRGGKCLSRIYANSYTKLKWKCSQGHTWFKSPSDVKQGYWCPECGQHKSLYRGLDSSGNAKYEKKKQIIKKNCDIEDCNKLVLVSEKYCKRHGELIDRYGEW